MQIWVEDRYVGDMPDLLCQEQRLKAFDLWVKLDPKEHRHICVIDKAHADEDVATFLRAIKAPNNVEWHKAFDLPGGTQTRIGVTWYAFHVSLEVYERLFDLRGFKPV